MRWCDYLAISVLIIAEGLFIAIEHEERTAANEELKEQITQIEERVETNRQDTALCNEITQKIINGEW